MIRSFLKNNYIKIAFFSIISVVALVFLLYRDIRISQQLHEINKYKKIAQKIVIETWNHYKNNENFEGDWWSSKFKHPKMILDDGRPLAFPDGLDVDNDGIRDIDWSNPNKPFEYVVVSESSSYVLLRAVWMRDKKTFDKVWKWTHDNLQRANIDKVYRWYDVDSPKNKWVSPEELNIERDNLFSWRWLPTISDKDGDGKSDGGVIMYKWQLPTEDNNPNKPWRDGWDIATDADADIALALIFADSLWGSSQDGSFLNYADHARGVLNDLWDNATYVVGDKRYLAGGDNIKSVEPGYLSPFSYRIFDDFDPVRDWMSLVDSSYRIFRDSVKLAMNPVKDKVGKIHENDPTGVKPQPNLLPDWLNVNIDGSITDGNPRNEPEFGSDSFRGLWRIAVDYLWNEPKAAEEVLFGSKYSPIKFFKWRMKNPPEKFNGPDKFYDLNDKLSSTFWHDGKVCLFEPNYEPDIFDEDQRLAASTGYRANCAQYAVYLSYAYAAKEYDFAEKFLLPLITDEQDGFSKREFVIPPDKIKHEAKENILRNTPSDKINLEDDKGTPFDAEDGWYCRTALGGYWTQYDQSDWNSQSEYFNNTWAWFGLATYAGVIKNFYTPQQRKPKSIEFVKAYEDKSLSKELNGPIVKEDIYIAVKGKDSNRRVKNFVKVKISSTDNKKMNYPITLKLAESDPGSGIFIGRLQLGMKSNQALSQIGASMGSEIKIEVVGQKSKLHKYKVGRVNLSKVLEDFSNGSIYDANPTSWWTDSIDPSSQKIIYSDKSGKGVYIWRDALENWHLSFNGKDNDTFQGKIYSQEKINLVSKKIDKGDFVKNRGKTIEFSLRESKGNDSLIIKSEGEFLFFDIKVNGVYDNSLVKIGQKLVSPYSSPFKLSNVGVYGTFSISSSLEKSIAGKYSLKVKKQYKGNDYPYFGTVIFDKKNYNWQDVEEFSMWVYLKEDSGNVRVDIQDSDGVTAILNSYNPWNSEKGSGWYLWRSNYSNGAAVNRDLVDPVAIKNRSWWKGWNEESKSNKYVTSKFNIKDIRNIQISLGPEDNRDVEVFIDRLALSNSNFERGTVDPKSIKKISLYKDEKFTKKYAKKEVIASSKVYIEMIGKNGSPFSVDTVFVDVNTDDRHPSCFDVSVPLEETGINTGIYRGELRVGIESNEKLKQVGCSRGHNIRISSSVNRFKILKTGVGSFLVKRVFEDFEAVSAGKSPASWWTDSLDPISSYPEYPAGRVLSFFIWKDVKNIWHLRWSSNMEKHRFSGTLFANKKIRILNKDNFEDGDYLKEKGNKIIFSANETFGDDGFDFLCDSKEISFDLLVDGKRQPDYIQVGKYKYKKAYKLPLVLNNKKITKTYFIYADRSLAKNGDSSLHVNKVYNNNDYPYFGKWGIDYKKYDFSKQDKLTFWLYLKKDVGNIRIDIEDTNGKSAILNEYNPWDTSKGAGWYLWDSSFFSGAAVAEKKIQKLPLKDRTWFKRWHAGRQKNIEITNSIDLTKIVNILFSVGGGDKKSVDFNLDSLALYRSNYHMGTTLPLRIRSINLYKTPFYSGDKILLGQKVSEKNIYVEIIGEDGNPFEKDRINVFLQTSDNYKGCSPISVRLYETKIDSGVYRGKFTLDLVSKEAHSVLGAARNNTVTVLPPVGNLSFSFKVGNMTNYYTVDNFEDGSVSDKNPVTWWTDSVDPVAKKVNLDSKYDKGVYLYRDVDYIWHLIWLPEKNGDKLSFSFDFNTKFKILDKGLFSEGLKQFSKKKRVNLDISGKIKTKYELKFKDFNGGFKIDSKINNFRRKDAVFIGESNHNPYVLPYEVNVNNSLGTYSLHISDDLKEKGDYSLGIEKKYVGNDYPYFGCWGLKGDSSDLSDKDFLSFWVYLYDDPGNIRVDIEDDNGNTAVLNGYNPFDFDKGEGWYLWYSNFKKGYDVDEGLLQPEKIKDRQWWNGWNNDLKKYVDVTDKINLNKIVNILFSIGSGDKKDLVCFIDNITLGKENYHLGNSVPENIFGVSLYADKKYKNLIPKNKDINQSVVFIKLEGHDSDPIALDYFYVDISSDDDRSDAFPVKVLLKETAVNSGVYLGQLGLGLASDDKRDIIGVEKGRYINIAIGAKDYSYKVGEIYRKYIIDNFMDGSVGDKNPVTWWTDTVDPISDVSIYSDLSTDGYYVWKDLSGWHVRWVGSKLGDKFSGSIYINGKFSAVNFYNFNILDKKSHTHNQVDFVSRLKDDVSGIDFAADSDFVEFDIKQNDEYFGKQVWIGKDKSLAYSIPFRLDNNKVSKTYYLSLQPSSREANGYMMKVDKKYNDKDYPYFGCWGLRGEISNWREMDEFYLWLYLADDPGIIKVELEDKNGFKGILNAYNPWDNLKGSGWYKWSSNYFDNDEVKSGNVDPVRLKNRKWWKAWDDNEKMFTDSTSHFDFGNVKNIQFIVGGGNKKDTSIFIDEIALEKTNYRLGTSYPYLIEEISFFSDPSFLNKQVHSVAIDKKILYVEILGKDSNPNAVDQIDVSVLSKGNNAYEISLIETSADSGRYRGVIQLGALNSKMIVSDGDKITLKTLGSDRKEESIKIIFDRLKTDVDKRLIVAIAIIMGVFLSLVVIWLYVKD